MGLGQSRLVSLMTVLWLVAFIMLAACAVTQFSYGGRVNLLIADWHSIETPCMPPAQDGPKPLSLEISSLSFYVLCYLLPLARDSHLNFALFSLRHCTNLSILFNQHSWSTICVKDIKLWRQKINMVFAFNMFSNDTNMNNNWCLHGT